MNICINFYGQQRDMSNCINMLSNNLLDNKNKFYILYTGWKNEEPLFEKMINPCFVRRITADKDKIDNYLKKYSNIQLDATNVANSKIFENIIYGFYIKNESINTINECINKFAIHFDLFLTLRIDTKILTPLFNEYEYIKQKGFQNVYVSKKDRLDWDIYKVGAISDFICISNYENTVKILNQLDNLQHCLIGNTSMFHPETSFCKYLNYNNFNIERLGFLAYRSDQI
jgi:hypothetical protein